MAYKNNIKNLLNNLYKTYYHYFLIIIILIITQNTINVVDSRRHSPLLIEDDGSKRNNRPAVSECQFGKTLRELGSTWYADLGPPFGVMYCIKCECVAVPKKRRIVARVQCRNIKNECPPALCDDPILLPGKCCKTCPGDNIDAEIPQDVPIQVNNEEEERNMKHFAALLTGRTSYFLKREEMKSMYTTNNPQNIIATGRFTFHKKNLYYSFYISRKIVRPRAIQFVDDYGTIVEEHNLQTPLNGPLSVYQNTTGKICGVWRRVPREYKRLLREDRLNVILLWGGIYQTELAIGGRIAKYTALSTELFSSLLEPPQNTKLGDQLSGAGGTAIVSTTTGAASSIHLTLVFNGIFNPDEFLDAPVNIRIEWPERKEIVLDEMQKVKKPSNEINVLEISSPISIQNLRLLSRGKLIITVESKKHPHLNIQGHITTRTSCELYQTLLTSHETKTQASGLAWVYMNTDGSLVYNIQTDHLEIDQNPQISLAEDNGKKKTALEDLTYSFNYNQAIGSIEKLGPRVLESLYNGDLAVNIGIENEPNLIRGRLISKPVADARDSAEPILLKRTNHNLASNIMGMAWLAIDNECNLHYEITMNGFTNNQQPFQIYLEEKPIEAINAPITRKLLEEFTGSYMEGFVLGMQSYELMKLETSVCYLEIYSKESKELLLRGKLKSTKVPSHCFPMFTDSSAPNVIAPGDHSDNSLITPEKCYHAGRFYDEAEQWKSTQESCTMCTCQHGRMLCDAIKCPNVKCRIGEELLLRDGECCPTCISAKILQESNISAIERGCQLGDQFHLAGATWHPYLPPNGFDTCTTCTCDPVNLEIHCPRKVCPPLACSEKEAYRPDKKACCKICPEGKSLSGSDKSHGMNSNYLRDEASKTPRRSSAEILETGGCKAVNNIYENGQEWHPIIASHGEQKCIKCRCKDSKVTCDRKRCTRTVCNSLMQSKRKGLPIKDNDECCTQQCKRTRRHQAHKKNHRDREHQHQHQHQNQHQHQHQHEHQHQSTIYQTTNNRS